jgi:transcriptional regulator with XRE-family HTH domain
MNSAVRGESSMSERSSIPFGPEMRRRRLASGRSLRELAAKVHFSTGYLSRIETGIKRPHADLAKLIDAELKANGELVGLILAESTDPVDDHHAVEAATPDPSGVVLNGLLTDPSSITVYEEMFHRYRAFGRAAPASMLVDGLGRISTSLAQTGLAAGGHRRPPMLRLSASYAEFLGWMLQEIGANAAALAWTARAVSLAEQAGKEAMASQALIRRALFALYAGDGRRTIDLATEAEATAGRAVHLRRLALFRQAQGHALMGDADTVRRTIDAAESILVATDDDASNTGLGGRAESAALVLAWCLVELGHVGAAAEIFDGHLRHIPLGSRRMRARLGVRHLLALVLAGDIDGAARLAEPVLRDVEAVQSATVSIDVKRLGHAVGRWHRLPAAQELSERINMTLNPYGFPFR